MIGVVLSGGQSTRMGQDKGLIELNGKVWARIVQEKLDAISVPTIISINHQQLLSYSKHFRGKDLVIDNPELQIRGPLSGLMSAHMTYPEQDILVVACDMISMNSIAVEELLKEYRQHSPEAIAFKGDVVEPMCAVYSSRGLKKIISLHSKSALKRHSMMHVLEILQASYLPIKEEWKLFFKNFNQVEDIDKNS